MFLPRFDEAAKHISDDGMHNIEFFIGELLKTLK